MGSPRWKRNRRLICWCTGYWFPHRRKSGSCTHNPNLEVFLARKSGVKHAVLDVSIDNALNGPGVVSTECPF